METSDIKEFGRQMHTLCTAFDKQISDTLTDVYFAGLSDLPIEAIRHAVEQAIKTLKFFPKVAELRDLCEGTQNERAQRAWQLLMEAVEKGGHYNSLYVDDQALAVAIRRTFSHWIDIPKEIPPPHDPMYASLFNRFCANYRLAEKTRQQADPYFVGYFEATNRQQVGQFTLTPAGFKRMSDLVEVGEGESRELPCVVEAVGEPVFTQKVCVIAGGRVEMREMEFSRTTGALTASARASLTAGNAPLQLPGVIVRQLTAGGESNVA
jgi:hypothetical protein